MAALEGRVEPGELRAIVTAVDDYTIGYTLREVAADGDRARRVNARWEDADVRYLLGSAELPLLARFFATGGSVPVSDFEVGPNWLLDGFAAQIG